MDWLPLAIAAAAIALFGLGWLASTQFPPRARRRRGSGDSGASVGASDGSPSQRDNDGRDAADAGSDSGNDSGGGGDGGGGGGD